MAQEQLPVTRKYSATANHARESGKSTILARRLVNLTGWGHVAAGTCAAIAAIATVLNVGVVQLMERQAQTLFFELRGPVAHPTNIVILALDEESLDQGKIYQTDPDRYDFLAPLEAWPWKRVAYATVIERLVQAGAKSVAVDILFDYPSSYGPEDDLQLQQVLQRYGDRVTLAAQFVEEGSRQGASTKLVPPNEVLQQSKAHIGTINYPLEPNGKIHELANQYPKRLAQESPEYAQFFQELTTRFPSWDEAALKAAGTPYSQPRGSSIFFYGPAGTFEQIPFWHVLDPNNWDTYLRGGEYFRDKIVLIGATAASYPDFHPAPFSSSWLYPIPMTGVEIHANAIATLMQNRAIAEAITHPWLKGLFVFVGVTGISFLLLSRPKRGFTRLVWAVGMSLAWGGIGYLTFVYGSLILPTAVPIVAIALSSVAYLVTGTFSEYLKKAHLRRTLEHYAASPIVQEILSQQEDDDLQALLQERERVLLGKVLGGRYKIVKVLGSGGFGETYIAEDTQRPGNPQCVVKQLRPVSNDLRLLKLARRLFGREAQTLERLGKHDQIPQLLAYFEENQEFYLVQQFIVGHPLSRELSPGRQLPEARAIAILKDLLHILEFIHAEGVIHRDIKPNNIIRRHVDGKLVLIDFGAVKEIHTQLSEDDDSMQTIGIGTRGYMPNEQCAGSPRFNSDIYAVGMTAIQSLTGLPPDKLPEDPKTGDILWVYKTQVSQGLAAILNQMVRYDFRQRYQSATEVLEALKALESFSSNHSLPFIEKPLSSEELEIAEMPTSPLSPTFVASTDFAASTMPWLDTSENSPQSPPSTLPSPPPTEDLT